MKTHHWIVIVLLTAYGSLQTGYLLKGYLDYKYGPIPMITPSEIVSLMDNVGG